MKGRLRNRILFIGQVILFLIIVVQFVMLYKNYMLFGACGIADAGLLRKQATLKDKNLPVYYQTKPERFPGV